MEIAANCERIFRDSTLAANLCAAGRRFAETHFDLEANTVRLEKLYLQVMKQPPAADWARLQTRFYDEADLFPLLVERPLPPELLRLAGKRRAHRLISRTLGRFLPPHRVLRQPLEPA